MQGEGLLKEVSPHCLASREKRLRVLTLRCGEDSTTGENLSSGVAEAGI